MTQEVGLLGLGASVPATVRKNDDPIFSAIDLGNPSMRAIFAGAVERRVLAPGEQLVDHMAAAARAALARAGAGPEGVDRLIGYESVAENITPNGLYLVHHRLGLPAGATVLPLAADFTSFVLGVATAVEGIAAGRSRAALVVCGSNWTRHVDYTKPHTVLAGDGAGAALVGPSARLVVVDYAVETKSDTFDLWTMKVRTSTGPSGRYVKVGDDGLPVPTYELSPTASPSFVNDGVDIPVRLAREVLGRNKVSPRDVTIVPHQTRMLFERWADRLGAAAVVDTFETLGNMSHASIPVTLAMRWGEIETPYILLMAVGTGSHFAVMLLRAGDQLDTPGKQV